MLSILIPTYNYSLELLLPKLSKQIANVEQAVEVCICDDASTQTELAAANKELASALEFNYVGNTKNLGRTATRELLATNAQYAWLLFLDADVTLANNNFLANYLAAISPNLDAVFGGIQYSTTPPEASKMLRWQYGRMHEAKSVAARQKAPYFIISQNLLITKNLFLKANPEQIQGYGLDIAFSSALKTMEARILHIDNPVVHLGLETSKVFLDKTLKGLETHIQLEQKGLIPINLRPMQRVYLKLKKLGLIWVFKLGYGAFRNRIDSNLVSAKPNINYFNAYRLYHFIRLKAE